jgi:hypothetical protein
MKSYGGEIEWFLTRHLVCAARSDLARGMLTPMQERLSRRLFWLRVSLGRFLATQALHLEKQ